MVTGPGTAPAGGRASGSPRLRLLRVPARCPGGAGRSAASSGGTQTHTPPKKWPTRGQSGVLERVKSVFPWKKKIFCFVFLGKVSPFPPLPVTVGKRNSRATFFLEHPKTPCFQLARTHGSKAADPRGLRAAGGAPAGSPGSDAPPPGPTSRVGAGCPRFGVSPFPRGLCRPQMR